MDFLSLKSLIKNLSDDSLSFEISSNKLIDTIFSLDKSNIIPIILEIGTIPEDIEVDSSEEKLYSKASDILLAKSLEFFGLDATVYKERSGVADVYAKSKYHNYSLVSDAKSFRLSRTAKNQKDFKVESMVKWKKESDYSILCCPYYQYPKNKSQIYKQALDGNVLLFSWEYLYLLLDNNIKETSSLSLANLWNYSSIVAQNTTIADSHSSFLNEYNVYIKEFLKLTEEQIQDYFTRFKNQLKLRGDNEVIYWQNEMGRINNLNREEAIFELLESKKLDNKIKTIQKFINQISN
ncbi:MAG: HindIII family type II restriction endonuclease [Alphaproteobacteria bacterium]|jgi:type II restriction enzyme|nr:HindIII family type II restriction endonuclease [Alphaproteobacteria bacterium]